jgi:hypothetical protein
MSQKIDLQVQIIKSPDKKYQQTINPLFIQITHLHH